MSYSSGILALIFVACLCFKTTLSFPAVTKDIVFDKDELDIIDLSYLGGAIYGNPKNSSGDRLAAWDPKTSKMNPEELGEYAEGDMLVPVGLARNGMRNEATRWPNAIVPFVIEGSYAEGDLSNIYQGMSEYHKYTCIRFVPYNGEADYITIGNFKTGCWSSVGRIGGRQEVNLQSPGCVTSKGTVIHELMHAIGFVHEQSRWERDNYVYINHGNILIGQEHNFDKAPRETTNDFGVNYDYGSIMHYGSYAFSSNSRPTIIPKGRGSSIGQRAGFSSSDVKKINTMYNCNTKFLGPDYFNRF